MNKKTIILLGAFFMTNTLATPIQAAKKLNLPEIKPVNFQPPDGERLVLKNGIKVYFIEDKTLPVVHIKALIRSGSIYDEDDKTGLGEITINLLRDGGTKKYKAEEIEHKLDSLGASIESNIAAEEASLEMTSLAKDFTEVLDIFSQMLINPSFEEDKVNIQKAEQLAIIDRRFDNIGQALSREALRQFFGPNYPYGKRKEKSTIKAISIADMQAWHKNYVQTGNIVLAVAGDFGGKERLEKELNNAFGSWEPTYTAYPKIPLPQPVMERKIFHIQKESAQAYIALVKPAPERGSKHEYALTVTNEILGGGLSSRLAAEVRSRRGLAYTVYSYAGKRELLGFEFTFCSTKPETYSQALETMLEQFKLIRQEKPSEEEINRAKAAITNSFVFRFPTPYSLITNRMTLDYYGYPKDYLKNYVQNIEKIAAGDVLQISKNMLNPDDMMIFVIGDASKFDKPLSTFGKVTELKEED